MLHYGTDKPFIPLAKRGVTLIDIEDRVFLFGFSVDRDIELMTLTRAFNNGWRNFVSKYPREETLFSRKVFASRKIFGGNDPPWVFVCNECGIRRIQKTLSFRRICGIVYPVEISDCFSEKPKTINTRTEPCSGRLFFSRYDEDNGWMNRN